MNDEFIGKGKYSTLMNNSSQLFRRAAALLVLAGLISIAIVCIIKFRPSSERMSPDSYFGFSEEVSEPSFGIEGETVAAVVVDDHLAQERALIVNSSVYIDYTLVQNELNSRFYWDSSESVMLFTTAEQIFEIEPDSSVYTIDGETFDAGYEIVKTSASGMFLSMNFMLQYSDLHAEVFESPARVVITRGSETVTEATVKKDSRIRCQGGIKSPILCDVKEGEVLTVLEELDKWSRVMTSDGYIGYIRNKRLSGIQSVQRETYYQAEYSSISLDGRLTLVWQQINYPEMNDELEDVLKDISGVNVISPTWYFLNDNDGGIDSFADASYVETAHDAGLEVWALISNFSENVSTATLLASRAARQQVQNYLLEQALELGFDGINIDFEYITQDAGLDFVQFMREMSILCRKNGIILSVDLPVPLDYTEYYNRKELGTVCDYVIMMGYDEHYVGSEAGSVASMRFEETGIEDMLKEVPKEKLISAIPFYSRVWTTKEEKDGSTTVTSEIVSMSEAEQLLADLGVSAVYDEDTGQSYASWTDEDGALKEIWLEDADSVAERLALAGSYELGGIAVWCLGFETADIWSVFS